MIKPVPIEKFCFLRVVLVPEGDEWTAQGLEFDYAVKAKTRDATVQRFEQGVCDALNGFMERHGTWEGRLKRAAQATWDQWLRASPELELTDVIRFPPMHGVSEFKMPFSFFAYLEPPDSDAGSPANELSAASVAAC